MFSMQGTPIISISQGVVLCATLRPGSNNAFPSCNVHALQLQPAVATAGVRDHTSSAVSTHHHHASAGSGSSAAAAAGASNSSGGGGGGRGASEGQQQQQQSAPSSSIGSGAVAQGRIAVATAGGVGPVGLSANNTVMLAVSDQERSSWSGKVPLVDDTGGRLTVMLTTPTHLVMATESGQVCSSQLLMPQQHMPPSAPQPGAPGAESASVAVLAPHASGSRFISIDF